MKTSEAFSPEAVGFTSPQPPLALGPAFLRFARAGQRLGFQYRKILTLRYTENNVRVSNLPTSTEHKETITKKRGNATSTRTLLCTPISPVLFQGFEQGP